MKKLFFIALTALYSMSVLALGPREEAWKLHNRLTGVPPRPAVLSQMVAAIEDGDREGAARIAMQNPLFITVVLKNWVKPWSNREQSASVPLNDYVATVLGIIRDDIPFDRVLYDDILYHLSETLNVPPYSPDNNDHYASGEVNPRFVLIRQTQSAMNNISADGVAGVITTRAAGAAFFSAGTNRRVNRFTFINYLCSDYEALHDTTIADSYVRRDVERAPGGDSRTYKSKCVGCHAGQDAIAGAWAYYDFDGTRLQYTPGTVVGKVGRPSNFFPSARPVTNDFWQNLWSRGSNAKLGWRGTQSGSGGRSLNQMLARSRAFSTCMASKVFKLVCLKDPVTAADKAAVQENATYFESGTNYSMKSLIAKTSAGCVANE